MIPFDKTGNVYALVTLVISNAANQLDKMEKQAEDTPLLVPLQDLQTEILLSLEKFQKHMPENYRSHLREGGGSKEMIETIRPHPDQRYGCFTYAQHGDDLMLLAIFDRLGIKNPFYVDIGAHHPSIISNTKLLYDRGSSGVNVDPSSYAIKAFNAERPRDQNLQVAIGPAEGLFDYYVYGERSGRNTLSAEEVQSLDGILTVQETRKVHVITYAQLIQNYVKRTPDLLLIDAEGYDYAILESIDFKAHGYPLVICVETRIADTSKMTLLLTRNGFTVYCRMGENLFFIRDDTFKAVMGLPDETRVMGLYGEIK